MYVCMYVCMCVCVIQVGLGRMAEDLGLYMQVSIYIYVCMWRERERYVFKSLPACFYNTHVN